MLVWQRKCLNHTCPKHEHSRYGLVPRPQILFLPVLIVTTLVVSTAVALRLSAVNGIYRDVQFSVPFVLQLGMMDSPVVYKPETVVPEKWRLGTT